MHVNPFRPGTNGLRGAVKTVAILNLAYFSVEFAVAIAIGSVALFADSIDFLEDASINFLVLVALAWSRQWRARVGFVLAGILLVPTIATLWATGHKIAMPIPPEPLPLSLTGAGALAVNLWCAALLTRYRHHAGSLSRAAFLSARNDVLANFAILAAGGITILIPTIWPDVVTGIGIGVMNVGAAREVFVAARDERGLTLAP